MRDDPFQGRRYPDHYIPYVPPPKPPGLFADIAARLRRILRIPA